MTGIETSASDKTKGGNVDKVLEAADVDQRSDGEKKLNHLLDPMASNCIE